jgi:acid phosphatase type 7
MNKKRTYLLLFVSILLLAIGSMVWQRWNVWFGNRPELPFTSNEYPHRILLTLGENQQQRMISWQHDSIIQKAVVRLTQQGTTDTLTVPSESALVRSRGGVTAFYSALIQDLADNTTYRYQVVSGNHSSDWHQFSTSPTNDSVSFIYIGDVQDKDTTHTSQQAFKQIQQLIPRVDFWAFGGDMIERPMNSYWNAIMNDLDGIRQYTPIIAIAGNHEYLKYAIRKIDERFTYTFPYFINNTDQNHVFSFVYGNVRFILLDSNREPWYIWQQRNYLKEVLESNTSLFTVVMLHHPVLSNKGTWNNLPIRLFFEPILTEYGVDLVLQGHEHGYARNSKKDTHGNRVPPIYITSHLSKKFYPTFSETSTTDTLIANKALFQHISISKNTLSLYSYSLDGAKVDSVSIVK